VDKDKDKKPHGQRGPDKDPEKSRLARQNAAKATAELRKKGLLGKGKKNDSKNPPRGVNPPKPGPTGSGPGPGNPSPPGPDSDPPRGPGGRNLGHVDTEERENKQDEVKLKWNSAAFEEALPIYLQQYVDALDKIARWFTRDEQATFKAWYEKLTDKEAKGDASLLAPVLKIQIPLLIQKYPVFVFLYVFLKLTFTKIRWKVVDVSKLKDVTPPPTKSKEEKPDGSKQQAGHTPGEGT
jgi:hypothetical protein